MTAAADAFIYLPLSPTRKEIRVVQIKSIHKRTGIVSCNLETIELVDNTYSALSYTWGEPTPTHTILLNGQRCEVRQNLYDFMRHAYKLKVKEWMFIDALCINQHDADEKSKLVSQMGEIYKSATRVLVFPGICSRRTDILHWIVRCVFLPRARADDWWVLYTYKRRFRLLKFCLESSSMFNSSLSDIVRPPVWYRLWVMQEVALARSVFVLLRSTAIDWAYWNLGRQLAAQTNHIPDDLLDDQSLACSNVRNLRNAQSVGPARTAAPWEVAEYTAHAKCLEPNDRIYAILGMLDERFQNIAINYGRPWELVVTDFVECAFATPQPQSIGTMAITLNAFSSPPKALCASCLRNDDGKELISNRVRNLMSNQVRQAGNFVNLEHFFWIFGAKCKEFDDESYFPCDQCNRGIAKNNERGKCVRLTDNVVFISARPDWPDEDQV